MSKEILSLNNIDKIFENIGQFGKYQCLLLILIAFISTITSLTSYSFVFIGATPKFRCKIPTLENDTYEIQNDYHKSLIDKYIPYTKLDNKTYSECEIRNFLNQIQNNSIVKCNKYVYSKEFYDQTLVTDWDLVCDRLIVKSGFTSAYFAGYIMVVFVGILGDKFGRKKILLIFLGLCCIFNILAIFVSSFKFIPNKVQTVLYLILRFLIGTASNVYVIGMVLIIELVGPKYRVFASNSFYYMFIFGELITLFFGYFIKKQTYLHVAIACYTALPLIYFYFIPESPRFLSIKNKKEEAFKIFRKIAKMNKKEFTLNSNDLIINEIEIEKKNDFKLKFKKAIKSKKFIIQLLVSVLNWFGNTFVYDGLSFNVGDLAGDPYLNYLYSTIAELVGVLSSHFCLQKFGRKKPYCIVFLIAGLSLLSIQFVPSNRTSIVTALGLIGKLAISFTFNAVYIVTAELYPTEIRNSAVSFCSALSRIGGVIAPYIQLLGSLYWYPLPYIIYGSTAILSSLSYFIFMPETSDMKLMDSLEEMLE